MALPDRLQSILSEGILASHAGEVYQLSKEGGDKVFVAPSVSDAGHWALNTAQKVGWKSRDPIDAVVVHVKVPKDVSAQLQMDPHSSGYMLHGDIKPDWITGVTKYDYDSRQWTQIKEAPPTEFYVPLILWFQSEDKSLKYTDDEPRDDHGRWSDGGGGSSSEGLRRLNGILEGHDNARAKTISTAEVFADVETKNEYGHSYAAMTNDYGQEDKQAPERTIDPSNDGGLVATQDDLHVAALRAYIKDPSKSGDSLPILVHFKNSTYVSDGHHRIAAAMLRGDKKMRVEYWDVDKWEANGRKALKYTDDEPRDDHGRWSDGGGGGAEPNADRVARALRTHKPSDARKQQWADKNQHLVAKRLDGKSTDNNKPMDVLVKIGGKLHGIEVKTVLDNGNDKITMHPASRVRKEVWGKQNKATLWTIVLDDRDKFGTPGHSGNRLYYRQGVGAFRLSAMTPVKSWSALRQAMGAKKDFDILVLMDEQKLK